MHRLRIYANYLILVLGFSCSGNHTAEESGAGSQLLFRSGFETETIIDTVAYAGNVDYRFIRGTDIESGFQWPISVLGASGSALHYIADDSHQAVNAVLQSVTGHDGQPTIALFQQENYEAQDDTQCPYEILNIAEGEEDLYISFWIKIDSASVSQLPDQGWRTFFEYKTIDYAAGSGFRLIAFIYTDENGRPYWHWQGDANPEHPIWEIDNYLIPVPTGQWFQTEFFWHWSNDNDGRALWRVNGEVIGDHNGPTTRNSKPVDFIMLAQIYGNANPKHQWIDDIEIRDGLPETN